MLTVVEAVAILTEAGITNSPEILRRWLRQGKIKGECLHRAAGWKVDETDLHRFIKEHSNITRLKLSALEAEVERLLGKLAEVTAERDELRARLTTILETAKRKRFP
ncbi:hypothetical protein H1S01_15840 [Heliobacterium chlorum]|uniref:Helix-turn-helix domain-containing protein n=1 Tax=Heliobacterium chlorum TaxID=2698 RepID=A0ABR7T588_HELCL|nr:hypothetical protein [Heliobacterium chlorum]MBC9785957.1 hypothetical protein [Heliobacterium chlorum]